MRRHDFCRLSYEPCDRCFLQEPTLLVKKGTDEDGLYQVNALTLRSLRVPFAQRPYSNHVARSLCHQFEPGA